MVEKKYSNHNNWQTPKWLYDKLDKQFSFDYDPCPLNDNPNFNGLKEEWGKSNFVNPPYGREIGLWVKKAHDEWKKGKTIVMLMPVRTDTNYFHNYILGKAKLIFIKGRLKFVGYSKKQKKIVDNEPASFPTMLVIYQSPTSQTSPKGDFSNEKEHNISLKESSEEDILVENYEEYPEYLRKRDVQEMVIRYIIEQENIWGDMAYTERINLMKVFSITDAMIKEYKQKEARGK